MMGVMRSERSSSVWIWVAGGTGLAALVAGSWWLLAEQTRGAEIATVLVLPVTIVALVVAMRKDAAAPRMEDLDPAFRELVEFLNRLFSALGTSTWDFARRHGFNPRIVYKIIKGELFPPPVFIDALISDIRKISDPDVQRQLASAGDLRKQSHDLYVKAAQALRRREEQFERLRRAVSDAENDKELAAIREEELAMMLRVKEAEREKVIKQVLELERKLRDSQPGPLMIEAEKSKRKAESRRASVDEELIELRGKLNREKQARIDAEKLGARLREAFTEANLRLVRSGGSPVELDLTGPGGPLFRLLRDSKVRWGGWVSVVGVVSMIYFAPFYFGLIYGSPGAPVLLKLSTVYGLVIVVWFAYVVKEIAYAESGRFRPARFLGVIMAMAALFFLGVFF
jgi:hypothetical protein